jgi:hypothetical protein
MKISMRLAQSLSVAARLTAYWFDIKGLTGDGDSGNGGNFMCVGKSSAWLHGRRNSGTIETGSKSFHKSFHLHDKRNE